MDEAIKQIGERLKGLREVLDISLEEMAQTCGITTEEYQAMENGESELHVSNLQKIAQKYEISLDVLMFGEEPHMNSYFLTRKGQGLSVERRKAYHYESLASGFRGRKADPFIVTVEPNSADKPLDTNTHAGQEFNMVLEGDMEYGSVMSGQVAGMVHEIKPLRQIFEELYAGGRAVLEATNREWQ